MPRGDSPLLTDLYQLNMLAAYLDHGLTDTAIFELFVRKLPSRRGFLMAAGLEQALRFLETVAFTPEDLDEIHPVLLRGAVKLVGSRRPVGKAGETHGVLAA
jgi:nicotinic acid phosphoribosyltransferase